MQAVINTRRLSRAGLVFIVLVALFAVAVVGLLRLSASRQPLPIAKVGGNWPARGAGDPNLWSGAEEGQVVPLAVAQQKAGFAVPRPAYLPDGVSFVQVHYSAAGPSKNKARVELRYTTGMWIVMTRRDLKPDNWALVDHFNSPEAGTQLGDNPTPWLKVKVDGIEASAHESNTETVNGVTKRTIPASVSWWQDGIQYQVFDVSGRTVAELLKVAESLK